MAQNNITHLLSIEGMTCAHCETRIEKALSSLDGVREVRVRFGAGTAQVTYDPAKVTVPQMESKINASGYRVAKPGRAGQKKPQWLQALAVAVLLVALFFILRGLGALHFLNAFPQARAGMGYGMLLVIGLMTSLHCMAMCGGINLTQCVGEQTLDGKWASLRPSALYNLGRVLSYTLVGGIVGAIGSVVSFSGALRGVVMLVAGLFMVVMSLNMLGLFPWLRKITPRMPKVFSRKLQQGKQSNSPLYVGLLNGFMPCGPLQAMQLYALSTGSPVRGALSMLLFSLGTVPLMFGLGALSSLLSQKFMRKMMLVSAVLVMILGLSMFQSGLGLSGLATFSLPGASAPKVQAQATEDIQKVTTRLHPSAYEPITVKAGIPVEWTIKADAQDINGCNNEILIPALQLQQKLAPGDNVIHFTPKTSGTIPYSCWMGMIRSTITVTQ